MNTLSHLSWRRLRFSLLNTRRVDGAKAHALSVLQAIVKGVSTSGGGNEEEENVGGGHLFFHAVGVGHAFKLRNRAAMDVEVMFVNTDDAYAQQWRDRLQTYCADPETGKNFSLSALGEVEQRCYEQLAAEVGATKSEGEICLEFLTPLRFNVEKGKLRTMIGKNAVVDAFEKRFIRLFGSTVQYEIAEDEFSVLPYYWNYVEIQRASASQPGTTHWIKGCVGKLYLKGRFANFLPFVILGSELHAGTKLSYSHGYYNFFPRSKPNFAQFFPTGKALIHVVRDVLQRYDHAAESLGAEMGFPFDEERLATNLSDQIKGGGFTFAPNTAFLIKKHDGSERIVERPSFKDLVVQEYLLSVFSDIAERLFENESIGYRKGVSRQKAVVIVQSARAEGYRFLVESDIEDFFPSVDLQVLRRLLEFYIPDGDGVLRETLLASLRAGYILNGTFHDRTKGIAQGSPLSPMLANIYLDSFDESLQRSGVKLIRYADDFIIMTKTRDEAEAILSEAETYLSTIGLRLSKEKTSIKSVEEGFQFLGITFNGDEVNVRPEQELVLFKKPLYITEPFLFLGLNGDAVEARRGKQVIETIPLRRVSELILMERTSFSTALIAKCTASDIPISIVLNSGYHITTIKPDTKKYYDASYHHARAYYSIDDTTVLSIAKEFAAGKLKNYIPLFKQKYQPGHNVLLHALDDYADRIYAAATVDEVRGLEGAATKQIYQTMNTLLENPAFFMKRRDRREPDMINSVLNFASYLLFSRINATVRAVGLNPFLGFLHSPENTYESLAYDIAELFRARIDRLILRLINLNMLQEKDFVDTTKGKYLTREASNNFVGQFEAEMEKKTGKETLSLKECIYVQVKVVESWALEGKPITFYRWE